MLYMSRTCKAGLPKWEMLREYSAITIPCEGCADVPKIYGETKQGKGKCQVPDRRQCSMSRAGLLSTCQHYSRMCWVQMEGKRTTLS